MFTLGDLFDCLVDLQAPYAKVILGEPQAGPLTYIHGDAMGASIRLYTHEGDDGCDEMDVQILARHILSLLTDYVPGPTRHDPVYFGEGNHHESSLVKVKPTNEDGNIIDTGDDITHVILEGEQKQ